MKVGASDIFSNVSACGYAASGNGFYFLPNQQITLTPRENRPAIGTTSRLCRVAWHSAVVSLAAHCAQIPLAGRPERVVRRGSVVSRDTGTPGRPLRALGPKYRERFKRARIVHRFAAAYIMTNDVEASGCSRRFRPAGSVVLGNSSRDRCGLCKGTLKRRLFLWQLVRQVCPGRRSSGIRLR
jgi:hypothetical protein